MTAWKGPSGLRKSSDIGNRNLAAPSAKEDSVVYATSLGVNVSAPAVPHYKEKNAEPLHLRMQPGKTMVIQALWAWHKQKNAVGDK